MADDLTPALLAALNVALKARQGVLRPVDVAVMQERALTLLDPGHPMRVAVLLFASTWTAHRHNVPALAELGAELQRAVMRAARPDPVDLTRRDIHG